MLNKRRPELVRARALDQYRVAVCSDGHKLIQTGADRFELYDLINDPAEQRDLSQSQPERLAALRRLIADFAQYASAASHAAQVFADEPDRAVAQRLRSLGYLD